MQVTVVLQRANSKTTRNIAMEAGRHFRPTRRSTLLASNGLANQIFKMNATVTNADSPTYVSGSGEPFSPVSEQRKLQCRKRFAIIFHNSDLSTVTLRKRVCLRLCTTSEPSHFINDSSSETNRNLAEALKLWGLSYHSE